MNWVAIFIHLPFWIQIVLGLIIIGMLLSLAKKAFKLFLVGGVAVGVAILVFHVNVPMNPFYKYYQTAVNAVHGAGNIASQVGTAGSSIAHLQHTLNQASKTINSISK